MCTRYKRWRSYHDLIYKLHKNKLLQSSEKAQLVPQTKRLQAVCDSLLFVSVYSGPSILMDWPVTDLGMHIPSGL